MIEVKDKPFDESCVLIDRLIHIPLNAPKSE